jgi:hypothetical protein
MSDFFDGDAEGIENAENYDMTEEEAYDTFDLAFSLGLGEEIGLEEAEFVRARNEERRLARDGEEEHIRSLRSVPARQAGDTAEKQSNISSLTGRYKCPYEQWIMDVAKGRKKITDPMNINIFEEEF